MSDLTEELRDLAQRLRENDDAWYEWDLDNLEEAAATIEKLQEALASQTDRCGRTNCSLWLKPKVENE